MPSRVQMREKATLTWAGMNSPNGRRVGWSFSGCRTDSSAAAAILFSHTIPAVAIFRLRQQYMVVLEINIQPSQPNDLRLPHPGSGCQRDNRPQPFGTRFDHGLQFSRLQVSHPSGQRPRRRNPLGGLTGMISQSIAMRKMIQAVQLLLNPICRNLPGAIHDVPLNFAAPGDCHWFRKCWPQMILQESLFPNVYRVADARFLVSQLARNQLSGRFYLSLAANSGSPWHVRSGRALPHVPHKPGSASAHYSSCDTAAFARHSTRSNIPRDPVAHRPDRNSQIINTSNELMFCYTESASSACST